MLLTHGLLKQGVPGDGRLIGIPGGTLILGLSLPVPSSHIGASSETRRTLGWLGEPLQAEFGTTLRLALSRKLAQPGLFSG